MKAKLLLLMICGFILPSLSYGQYNSLFATTISCSCSGSGNSGTSCSGFGDYTLNSGNSGNCNSAFGAGALKINTSGANNTGIGFATLYDNQTGLDNCAIGFYALYSNTVSGNCALGFEAAFNNTTAEGNNVIGYQSLYTNTIGANNSSIGYQTLYANSTGNSNSAIGFQVLYSNSTGNSNIAMGLQALYNNTTASMNVALGDSALADNTTGEHNTAVGFQSMAGNATGEKNTAVGSTALYNSTGSDNTGIGNAADYYDVAGEDNVMIGSYCGAHNTNSLNTFVGYSAGYTSGYTQSGQSNSFFGYVAGSANTSGNNNCEFGAGTGNSNATGDDNVLIGYNAGYETNSGGNTFVGYAAGFDNEPSGGSGGTYNTTLGYKSDIETSGISNATAIGDYAFAGNSNTVVLGSNGEFSTAVTQLDFNGALAPSNGGYGYDPGTAGYVLESQGSGVAPQWTAPSSVSAGLTATYIGYGSSGNTLTGNSNWKYDGNVILAGGNYVMGNTNQIRLDGEGDANWAITRNTGGGEYVTSNALEMVVGGSSGEGFTVVEGGSPQRTRFEIQGNSGAVTINKAYTLPTADGSTSQVLTTNGSGSVTWASPSSTSAWQLTGNSGTTYGTNFIGTTDDQGLMFQVDGQVAGRIEDGTSGTSSTSLGYQALYNNVKAEQNTAMGYQALYTQDQATPFLSLYITDNVAIGYQALYSNYITQILPYPNASQNTSIGDFSLYSNSTGDTNTAIGYYAGNTNIYGGENTFLGSMTGSGTSYENDTYVGYNAVNPLQTYTNDMIMLGNTVLQSVYSYAPYNQISDGRYKKNIRQDIVGLAFIKQLKPVSYTLDVSGLNSKLEPGYKPSPGDKEAIQAKEQTRQDGFIAQDVENAAQKAGYDFTGVEVPKDPSNQLYSIAYSEFVVPLVKAVQELSAKTDSINSLVKQNTNQQQQIDSLTRQGVKQQTQLDQLSAMVSKLDIALSQCCTNYQSTTTGSAVTGSNTADAPLLNQNIPNPFSQNTIISCYVPSSAKGASISIFDLNGQLLKSFTMPATGFNQVTISGGTLAAGDYLYTLFVDGQKVDTKKMTLTH